MARTKRPPLMHIPFAPPVVTGADPNSQYHDDNPKISTLKLDKGKAPSEKAPEVVAPSSTSIKEEALGPVGVTECPNCRVDFRNMPVADVRNHVESCNRPTTGCSETSELSEPPESPIKESADQLESDDEESDLEILSDLDFLEDDEEYNFDDLPGPYEEEEQVSGTLNDEFATGAKFPKLRDSNEVLASLNNIENMSTQELYRRTANVVSNLDVIQKEWMDLERETAKATSGDGTPMIRNPRAARENMAYQDRLEADVYGYVHNPHPTLLGRQDPISQREGGDDLNRPRLRRKTKKKAGDMELNFDMEESSRPKRIRNTPNRFESESREQTPSAPVRKPRGRGKGGRVGELRSEHDPRPQGARIGSPLAFGSMSENGLQSLPSLKDRALASTEADEGGSGANSRPTTSGSSQSDAPEDDVKRSAGKKRGYTSENEETSKPSKKVRSKANSGENNEDASEGKKKTRQKQLVRGEDGQLRTKQSLMMAARWKAFRDNPDGPRIGRRPGSQSGKGTGSEARSSRKRSLGESNEAADVGGSSKKQKTSKNDQGGEDKHSEQNAEAPVKGKRGGKRANSGRKPAKGSGFGMKKGGQLDVLSDRAGTPVGGGELLQPSSGSTRASKRDRKPTMAKQEADGKIPRGQWGGKREKGKRSDGTAVAKSKKGAAAGASLPLEEGMVAESDPSEDENDESASEDQEDMDHNDEVGDEIGEDDNEDETPVPTRKNAKSRKGISSKPSKPTSEDYPDLPVYDKNNPSAEYKALSKNLKMKAVARARWESGQMPHMFGQKGPNKTTKEKMTASEVTSKTSANSGRASVSVTNSVPPSVRRRRTSRPTALDGSDEEAVDERPGPLRRKISEYEEFQALSSPSLIPDGEGIRRRRPAALRTSTTYLEPNTSSDFEDEDEGNETGRANESNDGRGRKKKEKPKNGSSSTGRKGVGGRPPRIKTDVTDAAPVARGSNGGSGSAVTMTAYEEFLALSAPGSPMVLPKRRRRGGNLVDADEYYDYNDDD